MNEILATLCIARPGEIAWSLSGRYPGITGLLLTEDGQSDGRRIGNRLREWAFTHIFISALSNYLVWRYRAIIAAQGPSSSA